LKAKPSIENKSSADKRLRVESLSEKIAKALREDILFGRRRQGEPVTQQAIADEYGVSTMPVREALLTLSREGMLTARTNHTFRVARMTRNDVEDIYWMHGVLAGILSERACRNATPELIATLEDLQERLLKARADGDVEAVERLNWQFHREVNKSADSPKILAALRTVVAQIPDHLYSMLDGPLESSARDHPMLIELFKKKQCQDVRTMWAKHVEEAGALIIAYLSKQGYWEERG
jgi:DNA-binding GntR family transcriptional regulator